MRKLLLWGALFYLFVYSSISFDFLGEKMEPELSKINQDEADFRITYQSASNETSKYQSVRAILTGMQSVGRLLIPTNQSADCNCNL